MGNDVSQTNGSFTSFEGDGAHVGSEKERGNDRVEGGSEWDGRSRISLSWLEYARIEPLKGYFVRIFRASGRRIR